MPTLPVFAASFECLSGAHCGRCREREVGRPFRENLGRRFALPAGGVDFACPHGKPWGWEPPAAGVLGKVAHGVAGLTKAALGIDRAPADVRDARLLACARCAKWTGHTCATCGCFTAAKVRIAGEACPLGWWQPVPPAAGE